MVPKRLSRVMPRSVGVSGGLPPRRSNSSRCCAAGGRSCEPFTQDPTNASRGYGIPREDLNSGGKWGWQRRVREPEAFVCGHTADSSAISAELSANEKMSRSSLA